MRSIGLALACAIAMLATGCAGSRLPASVSGGIERVFPAPPHVMRGATPVDQSWIDETVEAGSTCCGWTVKPRPLALDPPKTAKPKQIKPNKAKPKKAKAKKLKPRVRKIAAPSPAAPSPAAQAPPTPTPKPPPLWLRIIQLL